jgi:hypothetical protein
MWQKVPMTGTKKGSQDTFSRLISRVRLGSKNPGTTPLGAHKKARKYKRPREKSRGHFVY